MKLRYLRRALNPMLAPPTDGTPAPPIEEEVVDLPGGAEPAPANGVQAPTMDIPPEEPPVEPAPAAPVDPNADLMAKMGILEEQNAKLMAQLETTNSDNEQLEEENNSILDLEHDDLVAMVSENPHGFVKAMMGEVGTKLMDQMNAKNSKDAHNKSIEDTIDAYAGDNDDFEGMWEDGQIKDFMSQNPGHNAISAHQMLTIAAKIAQAKKEGMEEAQKNFSSKQTSQTLGSGPVIPPGQNDAALKDTKKFGGRANVAARRAGLI